MRLELPAVFDRFFHATPPAAGPGPAQRLQEHSPSPPPPNALNASSHPVETHADSPSAAMLRRNESSQPARTDQAAPGPEAASGYEDQARQMSVSVPPASMASTGPGAGGEGGAEGSSQGGAYLCKRPANLPGNHSLPRELQLDHHWLKTGKREAGMGAEGGGVPGLAKSPDLPGTPTAINDHAGQSELADARCEKLPDDVDPACVERELELGTKTGPWLPVINDCQTVAARVIATCTPKPEFSPTAEGAGSQ